MFSTAEDNQTAVTVHVLQGEREMASANKSLGRFDLTDIPTAPRGIPQIEVTFDIDANGILHVSAKDKATGKEQSIVIKASSGLSDKEVEKMVRDAEAHKDIDRQFHDLVNIRNQADAIIHSTEKSMKDLGGEVTSEEKSAIEKAIEKLKEVMKGNGKEVIEAKMKALTEHYSKLAERVYAKKGDTIAGASDPEAAAGRKTTVKGEKKEDVVDAEFEEVKDEKKKDEEKK